MTAAIPRSSSACCRLSMHSPCSAACRYKLSCRSFDDRYPHQQAYPSVSFYIRRSRVPLLIRIAESAEVGLANDEEGMAEVYSNDLRKMLGSAELVRDHMLRTHSAQREPGTSCPWSTERLIGTTRAVVAKRGLWGALCVLLNRKHGLAV